VLEAWRQRAAGGALGVGAHGRGACCRARRRAREPERLAGHDGLPEQRADKHDER
jgi:hypothetical protein